MYDDKTRMILSTLEDILFSLELIKKRAETIKVSDDICKDDLQSLLDTTILITNDIKS